MLNEHDRRRPRGSDRGEAIGEGAGAVGVEVRRRLIEHQDPRPRGERSRQRQPLLLAAREPRRPAPLQPARPASASASGMRARIASGVHPRLSRPKATSSSTRSMTSWLSGSWNTSPTRAATAGPSAVTGSRPPTSSSPAHAPGSSRGTRPATARANVLLPDPDGPTTSRQPPGGSSTSMPSKAGVARSAYRNDAPEARIDPGSASGEPLQDTRRAQAPHQQHRAARRDHDRREDRTRPEPHLGVDAVGGVPDDPVVRPGGRR